MTDPQTPFFAADSRHVVRPVSSLADFETAAMQAASLVARGDIDLHDAAARLWDIAIRSGLAENHGGDHIQDCLIAAFNAIEDRLNAMRAAEKTGLVATCMADIAMKAIDWLWPDRIPLGKVT